MLTKMLDKLQIKPIINASATQTDFGGSIMQPKVAQAMAEASQRFFDIRELHKAVGRRIAELTRNEDAMVSGGVASALYLLTMALLKLDDPVFFEQMPTRFPEGKSFVMYKAHRVEYVCSIEQAGVAVREIGDVGVASDPRAELLEEEISRNKPLAFLYVEAGLWIPKGAPSLDEVVRVCRKHGVPVIVDGAAQLPPKSNLWNYTQGHGADVVLFSGGKDLRGSGHTGLVLGRADIVSTCRSLISPQDGVGRFFKVGREELAAALAAVELYVEGDEEARLQWCEDEVRKVIDGIADVPGVTASRAYPNEAGQPIPRALITYDRELHPAAPEAVVEHFLHRNDPRIAFLLCPGKGFYCNPMTLMPGESEIIIREIRSYFCRKQEV